MDQFWHHLLGLSEPVVDAVFGIESAKEANYDDLVSLGQQLFSLLCSSSGDLQFDVPETPGVGGWSDQLTSLKVQHHMPHLGHDTRNSNLCDQSCWQIDGERCKVNTPQLLFDRMPRDVSAVRAHMVSRLASIDQLPTLHHDFCPIDNPAAQKFAYDENIDASVWMERCLNCSFDTPEPFKRHPVTAYFRCFN